MKCFWFLLEPIFFVRLKTFPMSLFQLEKQ